MLLDTWGGFFKLLKYKIYLKEAKPLPLPLVAHHCIPMVVVVFVPIPSCIIIVPIPPCRPLMPFITSPWWWWWF